MTSNSLCRLLINQLKISGEVAEWLIAPVLKTGDPLTGSGGSNPSLSARSFTQ